MRAVRLNESGSHAREGLRLLLVELAQIQNSFFSLGDSEAANLARFVCSFVSGTFTSFLRWRALL
jgi:hypothetical protein